MKTTKKSTLPDGPKRTVLQALRRMEGCNCTVAQYSVGDGCGVCNPAKALEYAHQTMADLQAHRDMLAVELQRLRNALWGTYILSPEGQKELGRIQKALDFDA